jgi:hypothetical protein
LVANTPPNKIKQTLFVLAQGRFATHTVCRFLPKRLLLFSCTRPQETRSGNPVSRCVPLDFFISVELPRFAKQSTHKITHHLFRKYNEMHFLQLTLSK